MPIVSGAQNKSLNYAAIAEDAADLTLCKNAAPTATQMFNTWYRFSHDTSGVFPAVPSETTAWSLNSSTSLTNTTNSNSYIGLVSNTSYTDYYMETVLSSTGVDDDVVGVVAAFYKNPVTGKEYTLSLVVDGGGLDVAPNYPNGNKASGMAVSYNWAQLDAQFLGRVRLRDNGGPSTLITWPNLGKIKVRFQRKGDVITFECTAFYTGATAGPYLAESKIVIDVGADPGLQMFKGPSRIGLSAQSQQNSLWANISIVLSGGVVYDVAARNVQRFNTNTSTWAVDPATQLLDLVQPYRFAWSAANGKQFYINPDSTVTRVSTPGP